MYKNVEHILNKLNKNMYIDCKENFALNPQNEIINFLFQYNSHLKHVNIPNIPRTIYYTVRYVNQSL